MHKIQKILLKRLLINNNQRYSSLTHGYSFEDNIVFHLKQLLAKELMKKVNGTYSITAFIGFLCRSENKYLIKEHPKEKTNFYNLPSGKPRFGENVDKSLTRIFYENTGLKVAPKNFKYTTLHLKTIKTSMGWALFDDAFAIYEVFLDKNQKSKVNLHKQTKWLSVKEVEKLPNRWPEIDILIINKNFAGYLNYEFVSDYIL